LEAGSPFHGGERDGDLVIRQRAWVGALASRGWVIATRSPM
jgi:hypothetical protein